MAANLRNKLRQKYQNLTPSPMLKMFNATLKYDNLINLGVGEPDLDSPPAVLQAGIDAIKAGFTHYPPMVGFLDLRQTIAEYWAKNHKLEVKPQEIIVTSGGIQALFFVLQAFIEPGDEVIVTDPCFPSYINQVSIVDGTLVPIPVKEEEGFNLTAESLEKHITPKTKLLILNSPSNPTGAVLSRAEMEKIAKVVEKHDLLVISDEIYESFVFEGEHVSFATLPNMKCRTFTVGGFSKTYAMTGWRLGYLMYDEQFTAIFGALATDTAMGVNAVAQKAAIAAMTKSDEFVANSKKLYAERIAHVSKLINETPGLSCVKPKGSFYVMANISGTGMKSEEFCLKMLEDARVVVMPGISFGKHGDHFVRISCNGSPEILEEAFKRMRNALNGVKFSQ